MSAAPEQPRRRGRPSVLSEADQTKPRSVRLNQQRWDKLKSLGTEWLEQAIDRAKATDAQQAIPLQPRP